MRQILHVGDKTTDGSLSVIDEDRLCLQVDSFARGVHGIRTISKRLLDEWVDGLARNPSASSEELRDKLVGKSNVDRFEYGYRSTLYKLAQMELGLIEVIHANADYSVEFCQWFAANRGNGNDISAKKYISYFKTLTSEYQEPTHSYWHGLYRVMYAHDAEKKVIEIGRLAEFNRIYGDIIAALESKVKGEGMTEEGFQRAVEWFWRPEVKPHTCVTSALKAYADFLKWREERQKAETENLPADADRLTAALKVFAEKRGEEREGGEDSYERASNGAREMGMRVDGKWLAGRDYGEFRKMLNDRRVWEVYFAQHTEAEKRRLGDYLAGARREPKAMAAVLESKPEVRGLGPMTLTGLLMKVRPDVYAMYSEQMFRAVRWLGLTEDAALPEMTADSYATYTGIQTKIRDRMRTMGIGRTSEGAEPADYLTVNEFTWFVSENREAVLEEVMKRQLKDEKAAKHAGSRKALAFKKDSKEDELLLRLLAALRAKPFAILAGHSGTGKSRYAKKLAYMTCNAEELRKEGQLPGNFLLLQVRPNWHDSTDLLGYRNAMDGNRHQKTALVEFLFKAMHYRETPFFLCLDEMNLAPVEQYFAEFLSAMESKEPVPLNDITAAEENLVELGCEWVDAKEELERRGFAIPGNLFIVGTVNMDETTNQFSRKVLDRAFTIEMTDVDFRNFGKVEEPGYGDTLEEETIQALLGGRGEAVTALDGEDTAEGAALVRVQKALEETAFAIAYRFASEYTLLKRAIAVFDPEGRMGLDALDQAVLMKILPRVAGERDYIERVYGKSENEGLRKALEGKAVSLAKIGRILKRAEESGAQYVTFWP